MKKKNYIDPIKILIGVLGLSTSFMIFAQPILIEGAVPNEKIKAEILAKAYSIYGQQNVVDQIQVRQVTTPSNWINTVTKVINDDLKKVKQGNLTVNGTEIKLTGKLSNPEDIQTTQVRFQSLTPVNFRLNTQLSLNQAEQQIIDAALKNRIIEFESGSAILAASGVQILDEMAVVLKRVRGKKVKILGHTDSSGDADKNIILSQQRADAVKTYLIHKNIPAESLSTEGLGSNKPVADNTTVEGRKKNRRIEFEVL
ncbi:MULTISPECIES: OmpA family protein [unclassified Acinetobacter]|uniref:OmpA family protein n=1 Tax=unclassified Acinetobacter TaxID=196816 RepID=UPI0015D173A3|nr:OmpA family protein [Acinetobacter sp. YH16038]